VYGCGSDGGERPSIREVVAQCLRRDGYAVELKRYAQVLIIFHLQNSSPFSRIKEAAEEDSSLPSNVID
jgi:hypothetical protein